MTNSNVALWSPKGGSGTSVTAAALAVGLSSVRHVTLVDCAGDQSGILGFPTDIGNGEIRDVTPGLNLATPASATCLELDDTTIVYDLGNALTPFAKDVLRSDPSVIYRDGAKMPPRPDVVLCVIRGDYLALRRALRHPALEPTTSVVLVQEPHRALGSEEVTAVLDKPVAVKIPVEPAIARSVDAGVLAIRQPSSLRRPVRELIELLGVKVVA